LAGLNFAEQFNRFVRFSLHFAKLILRLYYFPVTYDDQSSELSSSDNETGFAEQARF
jgi:hypothetical protein